MKALITVLLVLGAGVQTNPTGGGKVPAALNFTLNSIDGKQVDLSKYQGRVVLMVNVASQCGYTPQYEGLEGLHKKYAAKRLSGGYLAINKGQLARLPIAVLPTNDRRSRRRIDQLAALAARQHAEANKHRVSQPKLDIEIDHVAYELYALTAAEIDRVEAHFAEPAARAA